MIRESGASFLVFYLISVGSLLLGSCCHERLQKNVRTVEPHPAREEYVTLRWQHGVPWASFLNSVKSWHVEKGKIVEVLFHKMNEIPTDPELDELESVLIAKGAKCIAFIIDRNTLCRGYFGSSMDIIRLRVIAARITFLSDKALGFRQDYGRTFR